eukprot:8534910-Alexandrium_andersonii.AAC.1
MPGESSRGPSPRIHEAGRSHQPNTCSRRVRNIRQSLTSDCAGSAPGDKAAGCGLHRAASC